MKGIKLGTVLNCLILAGFLFLSINAGGDEKGKNALNYDFKAHFSKYLNEKSAARLDNENFVSTPPALSFNGAGSTEGLRINLVMPVKQLDAFKGKSYLFTGKVKFMNKSGKLSISMRCFNTDKAEWKLLFSCNNITTGEPGKWLDITMPVLIPNSEDIKYIDFQVALSNSRENPAAAILDECYLRIDDAKKTGNLRNAFFSIEKTDKAPLDIVRDGKAMATLVTADNPTPAVAFAVKEILEHIELSTGVKLPLAKESEAVGNTPIYIGKTAFTEQLGLSPEFLPPDNWVVLRTGNAIVISGGDNNLNNSSWSMRFYPFGTLYAAYEFLERVVGVRWYWPGEIGRVIPRHSVLSVADIQWQGAPTYETRRAAFDNLPSGECSKEENLKWLRRLRWNGGVGGNPVGNHAFGHWDKKYGKEHPEWFALQKDGSRNISDGTSYKGHLCLTNPEVFNEIVAEKRRFFDNNPGIYSAVMPGDYLEKFYCKCEKCRALAQPELGDKGMYSKAVWSLVNRVASEIRKTHPGRYITCASYASYSKLPDGFFLEPNIAVTICEGGIPGRFFAPDFKSGYVKRINEWADRKIKLTVWEYWCYPRWTSQNQTLAGAPAIFPHALKEIYMLDRGKVTGRFLELTQFDYEGKNIHAWADWMLDSLNFYVAARLMWNLDQDVDAILDEFYREFYGPGAPSIKKFYEKMEAAYMNPNTKPELKWDWVACWFKTYPPEFVQEVMGYLRDAVRLTEGKEPYHTRAEKTLEGYSVFEKKSLSLSAAVNKKVKNENVVIPLFNEDISIDGRLDDAAWEKAAVAGTFSDSYNMSDLHAGTEMRLMRDTQNLYIGIRASLPDGKPKIIAPENSRDKELWEQESCEIFIFHDGKKYQFLIGPDNAFADNCQPDTKKDFSMDMFKWNCPGLSFKTSRSEKEWTAEIKIPLSSLALKLPTKDNPWKVNFCRSYYHMYFHATNYSWKKELYTWRPTFGSFHNPEYYGNLYFSEDK